MILKELREWINGLPEEFDDFCVVNGEVGKIDERYNYRVDKPITTLTVDEDTKEIVLMNDTVEEYHLPTNESDAILKALGDELKNPEFRKTIESETWDVGQPMFYVNDEGWLVEHHKDGTINQRRKMRV